MAKQQVKFGEDFAFGVALLSPEGELTPGERLSFTAQRLYFEGSNGDYLALGAQNGTLLALSFRDDFGHHTYGSGVMVGPGIALCAAHVLQHNDFYDKIQRGHATLVEPPRVLRRLQLLRRWSHEQVEEVLT